MTATPPITPVTLDPAALEDEGGIAYAALRVQAVALVQAMAGDIWTDYNESDPGVTVIEQLCYALTELPYRAALPMADILSPPDRAHLALRRQGLLPARSAMPCNPVTANDARRLVIDRVPGVANVWFKPRKDGVDGVAGLYEVLVLAREEAEEGGSGQQTSGNHSPGHRHAGHRHEDSRHDLAARVTRCYAAHRGLCEDILPPVVLRDVAVRVDAVVSLSEKADPSDTLARILFALGLLLAPEPRRSSLDEMLAGDAQTSDVFLGPLMLRGFIRDDQLTPFPATIPLERIRKAVAEADGVSAVDGLSVTVGDHDGDHDGGQDGAGPVRAGTITVPPGGIFRLREVSARGHPTIRMVRDRAVCQPDEGRTRRRLAELWRAQRRTHPLWTSYPEHYPTPASNHRPLAAYTSVQDQFPANYGIGGNALDGRASTLRLAQANQLKGYLMPFDQMLADGFAQLAFARDLLSVRAGGDRTYAVQSLRGIASGADILLGPGYEEGLEELSAETDPVATRQNAVLDLLLSFYAGQLTVPRGSVSTDPALAERLVRAKRSVLRRVEGLTRDRGKGLDYRRPATPRGASGVERTSRTPLALLWAEGLGGQWSGPDDSGSDGPEEVEDPADATFGKRLSAEVVLGVRHLLRPAQGEGEAEGGGDGGSAPWRDPSPLAGHRVASGLLARLHDRDSYRIVALEASRSVALVCADADGHWWLIGESRTEVEVTVVMERVIRAAGDRHWRRRDPDLRIVEWILLRDARPERGRHGHEGHGHEGDGHDDRHGGARYSFRVTAVLAADPRAQGAERWRAGSREILRANTPAHVALDCLYLAEPEMREFHRLYDAWLEALRAGSRRDRRGASRRLERFLIAQGAAVPDAGDEAPVPVSQTPAQPETPAQSETPAQPDAPPPEPPSDPAGPTPAASPAVPAQVPEEAGDPPPAGSGTEDAAPAEPPPALPPSPEADGPSTSLAVLPPAPPPALPTGADAQPKEAARRSWTGRLLSWLGSRRTPQARPDGSAVPAVPVQAALPAPDPILALPAPSPAPDPSPPPPPDPSGSAARVRAAPPGAVGFDTDTVLTASSAAAFAAQGFSFAIRYLSRATPEAAGDLDAREVADILGAGLALMAVQHVQPAGWAPDAELGRHYGQAAAANARAAGIAAGVTLWLDLEGVAAGTPAEAVSGYCDAWFQAVADAGYRSGLYVGADCGLDGGQLGALRCDGFWQSGSAVPAVEPAGYCMVQTIDGGFTVDGVAYDQDIVQADAGGGTPVWMEPSGRRSRKRRPS